MKELFLNKEGKYSLTAVAFGVGFLICNVKLLLSGVTLGSLKLGAFSGGDYAAAVAALGAVYVLRRHKDVTNGPNGSAS
jgi:hypothetical protein